MFKETLPLTSLLCLAPLGSAQMVTDATRLNVNGLNLSGDNRVDGAVLTSDENGFYACWADQFGTTEFTQDIYFASSTDDGANWSTPVRIDLGDPINATDSDLPKIAVADNGNLVCIWEDKRDSSPLGSNNEDVYYNLSTDGGVTWLAASLPLNSGTSGSNIISDVDRLWLSASGNTFHATWEEDLTSAGGAEEVVYTRSTDAGLTWSTPIIVSPITGNDDVDEPKVEADGNLVIVTWVDVNNDAVIARSIDGGANFSAPTVVESDTTGNVDDTILEVRGNTVLIAYNELTTQPGGEEVHCVVSNDGGATFRAEETLSAQQALIAGSDADAPVVAIQSESNLFVVYDEDSLSVQAGTGGGSAGNEVYVAYSNDSGATWTRDVPLNQGLAGNRPYVVATEDVVAVYFELNANGANIPAFVASYDSGATWTAPMEVSNAGPDVDDGSFRNEGAYVAISSVTNTVQAVFMDRPTGANEVYTASFLSSVTIGTNYCDAVTNSTGATGLISAVGSRQVADNGLSLVASGLPSNAFGFFLAGRDQGFVTNPGGSAGNLCLGGAIGRYVGTGQIQNSGMGGEFSLALDLTQTPTPTGLVSVQAGEAWNYTTWFRDAVGGTATSNFTNGLTVVFL